MTVADIPYEERMAPLHGGYAMIWPFRNLGKGSGPYELYLDNNALARHEWLKSVDPNMRKRIILNPALAWAEQWLSNPSFRSNAEDRIGEFIAPFVSEGFLFPAQYASLQARSLKKNDAAWRTQWMLVYLYVVLLYRIIKAKKGDDLPEKLLAGLKNQDVPIFTGCIMLCCLGSYLRSNQNMRLAGDSNSAYSYINSFISLHGRGKGESEFDENYLRNRVGDLSLWYALGALMHNGYKLAGEPVLVTQDRVLVRLILRCFPSYLDPSARMMFTFDERAFDPQHRGAIVERISATVRAPRPSIDRQAQQKRMDTLRDYVKQGADEQLVSAIDRVWNDWLTPGFNSSFQPIVT